VTLGGALLVATLAVAILDWLAVAAERRAAEYVLKPLTLGLLIAAAAAFETDAPTQVRTATLVALALSLVGDVLLMVPGDRFVAGLVAFLLAHVAYVVAFNPTPPPLIPTLVAAAIVAGIGTWLFVRLRAGMARRGLDGLAVPVAVYAVVIGAMVVSAAATLSRPEWTTARALLAVSGAVAFYASDTMIAWSRFLGPVPGGRVSIMVTYHLGQIALVAALLG
jgi:uncharacterized membrane protein YhhN